MVSAGRVGLLSLGKMVFGRYESARLVHGRMWPMRGDHYDNIFLHYKVGGARRDFDDPLQPRGGWYEGEGKTKGEVMPITIEYVRLGEMTQEGMSMMELARHKQRQLRATNWSEAWRQYQDFLSNSPVGLLILHILPLP